MMIVLFIFIFHTAVSANSQIKHQKKKSFLQVGIWKSDEKVLIFIMWYSSVLNSDNENQESHLCQSHTNRLVNKIKISQI